MGGRGDWETRGRGDAGDTMMSPRRRVSPSPCLPVSPYPRLRLANNGETDA